jgi:hypothetical protein
MSANNNNASITSADANDKEIARLEDETEKWIKSRSKELRSGRKLSKTLVFGGRCPHALDDTRIHTDDPAAILKRYGN